jgi:hypothetical protein
MKSHYLGYNLVDDIAERNGLKLLGVSGPLLLGDESKECGIEHWKDSTRNVNPQQVSRLLHGSLTNNGERNCCESVGPGDFPTGISLIT